MRLRCRRPPTLAMAQLMVASPAHASLARDEGRRAGPKSCSPAKSSVAPSARSISVLPHQMASARAPASRLASLEASCSSKREACAFRPSITTVRLTRPKPGAPLLQRSTMGRSMVTPSGTWMKTPSDERARATCPKASSAGSEPPPSMKGRTSSGRSRGGVRKGADDEAGSPSLLREDAADQGALVHVDERRGTLRAAPSAPRSTRGRRGRVRLDGGEVDRPQVQVGDEELVGLGREVGQALQGGQPVGQQPLRLSEGAGGAADVGGRGPGQLQRGDAHPSAPSISSLTRRLNSMAYSIGSSLVKTSRKPCTMRFWASFSVRPRLIR